MWKVRNILFICKILGFHCGVYGEYRPLGCDPVTYCHIPEDSIHYFIPGHIISKKLCYKFILTLILMYNATVMLFICVFLMTFEIIVNKNDFNLLQWEIYRL
jgi:hypothetical protein